MARPKSHGEGIHDPLLMGRVNKTGPKGLELMQKHFGPELTKQSPHYNRSQMSLMLSRGKAPAAQVLLEVGASAHDAMLDENMRNVRRDAEDVAMTILKQKTKASRVRVANALAALPESDRYWMTHNPQHADTLIKAHNTHGNKTKAFIHAFPDRMIPDMLKIFGKKDLTLAQAKKEALAHFEANKKKGETFPMRVRGKDKVYYFPKPK